MNRRSLFLRTTLVALTFSALTAGVALAQGLPSSTNGPDLSIDIRNPLPGQNVTISAESYSFDINSANITWTANGKTVAKGIGLTHVTVQAPALGKFLTVTATAVVTNGNVYSNSYAISSGSVDMIIEPDGYAPPLFQGMVPVAYQNSVKITAIPHIANAAGVEYDPKTLVYSWKEGDTVLQDQSGYGKQSVSILGSTIPRPYVADVIVTTRDGSLGTEGAISVSANTPYITLYRNDPLYGPLFNNALGDSVNIGSQQEIGVLAVPYGFNMSATSSDPSFAWSINSTDHPELTGHQSVTLRAPTGVAGASDVQLTVTGVQDFLQQANAGFTAIFSNSASSTQPSVSF